VLECVPNVAEGRDPEVVGALTAAAGPALLDVHVDADHHRAVLTLAGPGPRAAADAARALAAVVADRLDLSAHDGVHPRLGALDVVPFVALEEPGEVAVGAARAFGAWLAEDLGVPTFFYDAADPEGRSLPALRREAFATRGPDVGPAVPHPRLGATAVGARPPLVAVNCWLDRDDLALARRIASAVREAGGGGPGVRALGLRLPGAGRVQVSMNVTDLEATGVEAPCTDVRDRAEAAGAGVRAVEWVGLVPAAEVDRCSAAFRAWSGLGRAQTIEARLAAAPRR
jgi:glutamate formiminotransferase / 5-formyltetrahydrofolate cyclo-ligase